jgi:hypothetical protein
MRLPGIYRVITHYLLCIVISDYRVTGNIQLRLDMNPLFMNTTYVGDVSDVVEGMARGRSGGCHHEVQ